MANINSAFIEIANAVPDVILEIRYYSTFNFVGERIDGYIEPTALLTKEAAKALKIASDEFASRGYRLKIYDAYRPVSVQQSLWDYYRAKKAEQFPDATPEEIDYQTLFCVSFPSYNILLPSLHNTGGAVDLTIVGPDGEELDMGCGFDEFSNRAWTTYYEDGEEGEGVNDVARDNRRMLYNVMTEVGFTNFPAEWWHFDYGDEKWGLFTDNAPIYGGVLDADVRDTVPYNNMELVRKANAEQQEIVKQIKELRERCKALDEEVASVMRG